jgi:hypothetical protein
MILRIGQDGRLPHFRVRTDLLPVTADYVADTVRRNYPFLIVPPHSRWRHFCVGSDLMTPEEEWNLIEHSIDPAVVFDSHEWARSKFDLVVMSVLLDAGAGPRWRFGRGTLLQGRSEGLAAASLDAWSRGVFSSHKTHHWRADAQALQKLGPDRLGREFQVSPDNPIEGLEGRARLVNRLGDQILARPDLFGAEGRLGGLYDTLAARSNGGRIAAPAILSLLLDALGPVWAGRLTIDGIALGDTWRHPAIDVPGPTQGLIPFHKLSQWLAYSLIEPLEEAGIVVTDLDGLTGLAEYRNGGLFLDMGVIEPRDARLASQPLHPGDEAIVEWRALTVALLDEIAPLVRSRLGKTAAEMPLASILEGGTWAAGRRIAKEKRADGGPPLSIVSDGSVF